jgi:hypothetical protein
LSDLHTCRLDEDPDHCAPCQSAPSGEAMVRCLRAMDAMSMKCSSNGCDIGRMCFTHRMAWGRFVRRLEGA